MFHLILKHRKKIFLILPCCLLVILISFLSGNAFWSSLHAESSDRQFRTFTRSLFQTEVSANTISLHYTLRSPSDYGIADIPATYGSLSSDPVAAKASVRNVLSSLQEFDPDTLSSENALTFKILDTYLKNASTGTDYLLYQEPLGPVSGIHTQLPVLLSEYSFYDTQDVETYLALLKETPSYFDSVIRFEQKKAASGLFMPDYQADSVLDTCQSFIDMGKENYLVSTFNERIASLDLLPENKKDSFQKENMKLVTEEIYPAYQNLITAVKSLKGKGMNEQGLSHFPYGKKYYEYLVRQTTGCNESIPRLRLMTRAQILEDLSAMQKVLFPADAALTQASVLEQTSPDSMLDDLRSKITDTFPEIPDVDFQVKYVPESMQDYLSPAFYMIPAIDNLTENVIYINNGQTASGLNLYTTLAHEGYPGHLYQTVYFSASEPDPIRSILDFGGYVEGWATYAEMMSYYLAPLPKTEASLLQKNSSVILGLYALADMGIHYDGWSVTDTVRFFSDYGINDPNAVQSVYKLIIGSPANYLKYYIGYLKFYELKKEMADALGNQFSQKEFHRAVLDVGPAPFEIVYDEVEKNLLD
ncbi:DUF885 domain-containing protein [Coprococcus comes]|uniref:DUF885 domain-containing protein n=1 Tax=Coprococcus comes TaxID=410072 RepID=UPI00156FBF6F|nr:DUF885 domain-containing protein [Coprococcus comes]NSE80400.1 DUF885 domain-containing protein [Coprococcus comes]NSE83239.1 DUF885 domain-containing protein [Coprococcus comes]NSF21113.1 DUF885 domain-containing protein [Coprococcus comes]